MRTNRCILLAAAAAAILAPGATATSDADGNVLVILCDDLGLDWLGLYGVAPSPPNTPNLDALAADGVTFLQVWGGTSCSPTRASIQTGRYAFRTGLGSNVDAGYALPTSEVTLPELLDLGTECAYEHAYFGKWHLGNDAVGAELAPNTAGWAHFAGAVTHAGSVEPWEDYFTWNKVTDGVTEVVNDYVTSVNVDDAVQWISTRQDPWLCFVGLTSVHTPVHAPPAELHSVDLTGIGMPNETPVPYMQAMIEAMDTEIGRLLASVDPLTTTVIFLADNGTSEFLTFPPFDPQHAKNSLFQGGLQIPMIVRSPLVASPGSVCGNVVNSSDLFATVADIAGLDPAALLPEVELDSVSFLPYLADPDARSNRTWIFSEGFWPNGPRTGTLAPPVPLPVCQPDLGQGGPGDVTLTACGDPVVVSGLFDLKVEGVQPFAPVAVVVSSLNDPTPFFGGTLVPNPVVLTVALLADSSGEAGLPDLHVTAPGPFTLYLQAMALDTEQQQGLAISNALEITFQAWDTKAMTDGRWKLIADVNAGYQRFFDLELDPFELNDLLTAGPLSPEAQAAYDFLTLEINTLIAP
ncbi:MAG: sulfatase-like hydrolase/transferase [Planctomycetota bacterium]